MVCIVSVSNITLVCKANQELSNCQCVWAPQSLDPLEGVDLSLTQRTVVADVPEALHTEGDETAAGHTPKNGGRYT